MLRDLAGQRFGRWTVIEYVIREGKQKNGWWCRCDCGKEAIVDPYRLTTGRSQSCGCLHNELFGEHRRTHGGTNERLYTVWVSIMTRCKNKNAKSYKAYGGRGIKVCSDWEDYGEFRKWALSNGYDANASFGKCTIDRIDTNGDYSPENCRWVSMQKQQSNRSNNHIITFQGRTQSAAEWARETGINSGTIVSRINKYKWSAEDALTIKPKAGGGYYEHNQRRQST